MLDSASLIAAADFVLGAGGVMAREAAALRRAASAEDIELRKKGDARTAQALPRDPALFVDRLLGLARRRPWPEMRTLR